MNSAALASFIHKDLAAAGFQRKLRTWYLRNAKVIAVLNIQKSRFESLFFLNLGFWLCEVEACEFPRIERCHIGDRAEGIWKERRPSPLDFLHFEKGDPHEEEKLANLQTFVTQDLIPFLIRGCCLSELREIVRNEGSFMILKEARPYLGLSEVILKSRTQLGG